jgi:hypothetical protein
MDELIDEPIDKPRALLESTRVGFVWGPATVERLTESEASVFVQVSTRTGFVVLRIGYSGDVDVCDRKGNVIAHAERIQ